MRNNRTVMAGSRRKRMAYLRGKLLERRRKLLERMHNELAEPSEPIGVTGDTADMADSASARETSFEIGSLESQAVAEIDYVLQRLESGKYGVCDDCGKRIPDVRLKAVPFAYLCVECKQKDEEEARSRGEDAAESLDRDIFEDDPSELENEFGTSARRPA